MINEHEIKKFKVYGRAILGLAPFSMEPKISRVAATYKSSSPEEAYAKASVQGFTSIDRIVEVQEVEAKLRLKIINSQIIFKFLI